MRGCVQRVDDLAKRRAVVRDTLPGGGQAFEGVAGEADLTAQRLKGFVDVGIGGVGVGSLLMIRA